MKQLISPEGAVLGLMVLIAPPGPAAAQVASPTAATRPAVCDTAGVRTGLATVASYDRPFTSADPVGVRPRHAVLGPAGAPAAGTVARGRRVRKDARGDRVGKDRRPVAARKDSAAWCPQLATTPGAGAGVGEVTGEMPVLPNTGSAPGEVLPLPQLPGSVARRGTRFFLPPLLGGALLGGSAIALANRPRGGTAETPRGPVTPLVPVPPTPPPPTTPPTTPTPTTPTVPAAPTPTPPPAPGGPVPPTAPPSSTTPTPGVPATPTTPLVPTPPADPVVPTATVPEPATVVLLATGLAGLGAARRRRRRASR